MSIIDRDFGSALRDGPAEDRRHKSGLVLLFAVGAGFTTGALLLR